MGMVSLGFLERPLGMVDLQQESGPSGLGVTGWDMEIHIPFERYDGVWPLRHDSVFMTLLETNNLVGVKLALLESRRYF